MAIALRGHKDYDLLDIKPDLSNLDRAKGNFRNLLKFRLDAGDQILLDHLKNSGDKAKYISPMIQNQILEICDSVDTEKLVNEVSETEGFVILDDETADITNKSS
nr:unnamed protein product [Callosobruchus analis]